MADEKDLTVVEEDDDESVDESSDKTEAAKSNKSVKDGKPAKKKKSGAGKNIAKYFRDLKGEFKKIIWPTRNTIVRNTAATLAMCAIIGLLVSAFDLGLSALVELMLSL